MTKWYNSSWNEVIKKLNSNATMGLSENRVKALQDQNGKNIIIIPKSKSFLFVFLKYIKQLWVISLIASVAMFFYTNHIYISIMLCIIILMNLFLLTFIDYKEEKSFLELEKLDAKKVAVIRNGKQLTISSEDLVVGDVVVLNNGEIVPADLRIIKCDSLKVIEGAVTGEGYTVEKYHTKIEDNEIPLSEMKNILFKSSVIMDGTVRAVVIATGMNTQIANILNIMFEEKEEKYLLKNKLQQLINKFSIFALITVLTMGLINFLTGKNINEILYNGASILIAFIPETIFIIIAIASHIIINSFNKKGVKFKNLSVVENISQTSLICEDKVGVFSEENAYVEKIYVNEKILNYSDIDIKEEIDKSGNIERMIHIGLLCNNTKKIGDEFKNFRNDLFEIGIINFGMNQGIIKNNLELIHERIFEVPFDTERRIMTTINKVDENYRANVKGAVDSLLGKCTHILKNGIEKEITEEDIRKIKNADIAMSNHELSVMGFAYRNFNYEPSLKENIESNLVFAGLMGFYNPIKPEVNELLNISKSMHIKSIIITEDNKLTGQAFGKNLGVLGRIKKVLSGVEIDNMGEDEFERIIEKVAIFSRVSSKHKTKIAKYYKEHGHFTVMTGERVTDLPYLKMSNIGISIGKSNIVKKLADIIIKNRSFKNLLHIIKSSRQLVSVIRKSIIYIFTCSISQVIYILMSSIMGNVNSLLPSSIIFTNSITIALSSIAIILDYSSEKINYVPDNIDKSILDDNKWEMVCKGLIIAIMSCLVLYINKDLPKDINEVLGYTVLNLNLVFYTISFSEKYIFKNLYSNIAIAVNVIMQILFIFLFNNNNIENLLNLIVWKNSAIIILVWIAVIFIKKKIKRYDEVLI
ncbi:cation-transporting P-type ATPase [Clostridium rectalis]|uniref:P-type ATPase n=1 Tax=Clostridium rectalis TaxID=2040295 RepID=UPI000F643710|nr:cation-transporting P-type ATPase [Clostridium rectalis]